MILQFKSLSTHLRTGCPFDTSDCAVNFDSHVFWVDLSTIFAATGGAFHENLIPARQVGFVGKNQSVLLDRAAKARVEGSGDLLLNFGMAFEWNDLA